MIFRLGLCGAALAASLVSTQAFAEGACVLKKPMLDCGSTRAAILDAMANPETLAMLQGLRAPAAAYIDGRERETFRKSLEKNRKAAQVHADRAFRQRKRKRISAEDYEAIRAKFEKAMEAYSAGMNIYRDATWYSSVKPYQAD